MKNRTVFVTLILLTAALVLITGGVKNELSMEEAYEIMAGTWINEEYNSDDRLAKFIMKPDGTYTSYPAVNSEVIPGIGTFTIIDSMIDSDGNIWMKQIIKDDENLWKETKFEIIKISDNKMIMEVAASTKEGWYGKDYPAEIIDNTISYTYYILYRQ